MTKIAREKISVTQSQIKGVLPIAARDCLAAILKEKGGSVYLSGGSVRDLLLSRSPLDIDLTVKIDAGKWATSFAGRTGAPCIPLGREEDAARVIQDDTTIDFSSFRLGAETIEEEMTKRDLTINSLAVCLDEFLSNSDIPDDRRHEIIDPVNGLNDLSRRTVRFISQRSITEDPLRLLRLFRFSATLDFSIHADSLAQATSLSRLATKPAAERIAHELHLIMGSKHAHDTIELMARCNILFKIFPELKSGRGMAQPASHHLDVFGHNLETLRCMEMILTDPNRYFPGRENLFKEYLDNDADTVPLKWAALFHDLGKPATYAINEGQGGRIIFHNHDQEGAALVRQIASRLKWSKSAGQTVSGLVADHMRPFHLCNLQRKNGLTTKACLRFLQTVEESLPAVFLLGMADSLAGQGDKRPERMEHELNQLLDRIEHIQIEHVKPVRSSPPLLTGNDLIHELRLEPGPIFREVLQVIEEAHLEKKISSRQEALDLAARYLNNSEKEQTSGIDRPKPFCHSA